MNILVIDAQGGGIGKQVVAAIKQNMPEMEITAVGTNSAAPTAIGQSNARRLLIPVNHCDNFIVGVSDLALGKLIEGVISEIRKM